MGKDIKEKYERVCAIKDKALSLVETQLNGDLSQVDAKELGEVADIAKDMAEVMKLMEETCYYHKVTEAMEESSEEEKKYYMGKYIPEYEGKFYTPIAKPAVEDFARRRDSRGRYMYTNPELYMMDDRYDDKYDRMYYTEPSGMYYSSNGNRSNLTSSNNGGMNYARDMREGRSGISRRTYMELKEHGEDKNKTNKELEKYMSELSEDMSEMIANMDSSEKATLKQKLATIASKIN